MMKKVFALLLAVCMLAALAACGGDSGANQPSNSPSASQPGSSPSASAPDNTPAEPSAPAGEGDVDLQKFFESLLVTDTESPDYFNPDVRIEAEMLDAVYPGLSGVATRQVVIYQPMMGAVACEIALVEVENAGDVQKVKDIFQARIDAQVGTDDAPGGAWYPETIEGWKNNSRIVDHGNYVMMIVWEKADQFVEQFNALF